MSSSFAPSASTVFTLLDAEWTTLAATRVPACWRQHPALDPKPDRSRAGDGSAASLGDLIAVTERRDHPEASDLVLAALVRFAAFSDDDDAEGASQLAARTLLQALLPGAKALARRLSWLGDAQERAAAVVAALYERIRTYPIDRRPARIAANLLADTHQHLLRRAGGRCAPSAWDRATASPLLATVSLEDLAASGETVEAIPTQPTPAEELLALLAWAVRSGRLSAAQARLIGQTRLADVPAEELGAAAGLGAHSLRRRRQRAEQALRHAVLAGDDEAA
jgi:DNA-directed RNA polymerase specialized sigma24 family protein